MKILNEIKLSFPSRSQNESFARMTAAAFSALLDPTLEELSDIKTAVSEAVTNSIVHGYRNKIGDIEMVLRIYEDGRLYIRIKDKGCGIEDIKKAMEPLYTTAPAEERAGLGFCVMESFMDKLRVSSKVGKGTSIVMEKNLKTKQDD